MLQVQNLHKSYGTATVLDGINFVVNDGEHVGLIGPNGAGKTTLLRIITEREEPDTGTIVLQPRELRVGYLAQAFEQAAGMTVGEALAQAQRQLVGAEQAVQHAAEALSTGEDMDEAMRAYEEAMARYEALGGWERGHHVEAVLEGLGLSDISRETQVEILSGGQKTRLGLALLLLQEPGLLLLDEPTNHLDVEALEWLEGFVQSYKGSVVVVSHDREFPGSDCDEGAIPDPVMGTIKSYTGNYSDFEAEREREYEAHVRPGSASRNTWSTRGRTYSRRRAVRCRWNARPRRASRGCGCWRARRLRLRSRGSASWRGIWSRTRGWRSRNRSGYSSSISGRFRRAGARCCAWRMWRLHTRMEGARVRRVRGRCCWRVCRLMCSTGTGWRLWGRTAKARRRCYA